MFFKKKQPCEKTWAHPVPEFNRIVSQHVGIDMTQKHNILCFMHESAEEAYIRANVRQQNANYIIPDPDGVLYNEQKAFLEKQGYNVQVLNFMDCAQSITYNPFAYIEHEDDIHEMVDILFEESGLIDEHNHTEYAKKLLRMLCTAVYHMSAEKRNIQSVLDLLYQEVSDEAPLKHFEFLCDINEQCAQYYQELMQLHPNTAKSVLIITSVQLSIFNINELKRIFMENHLNMRILPQDKQALFIVYPEQDTCFYPLVKLCYAQLTRALWRMYCRNGESKFSRRIMIIARPHLYLGDWRTTELAKHNVEFTFFCKRIDQWYQAFGEELPPEFCDVIVISPYHTEAHTLQYVSQRLTVVPPKYSRKQQQTRVEPEYPCPGDCFVIVGAQHVRDQLL